VLIQGPPTALDIRIRSAKRIWVAAAALLTTASCSIDAPSVDERSIEGAFRTEPEVTPLVQGCLRSENWIAIQASDIVIAGKRARMEAYYGALLRLPNEALFWPAPSKSNSIGESHE